MMQRKPVTLFGVLVGILLGQCDQANKATSLLRDVQNPISLIVNFYVTHITM